VVQLCKKVVSFFEKVVVLPSNLDGFEVGHGDKGTLKVFTKIKMKN